MTICLTSPAAATTEDPARLLPRLAEFAATRRRLLLAPLLAALPLELVSGPAAAIDLGCVKTPKLILRIEISSDFINLKNKNAGDHPREKTIEKTILRLPHARTFSHSLDPSQTQVTLPDQFQWKPALPGAPPRSVETVPVFGATDTPGPYVVLVKWYPGYMSAPHSYVTDRLCFVLSGTWWVNSGESFEPDATVPVPAGGFVRRVAHTPHYDGVKKGEPSPAVIGIFGQAPVDVKWIDPGKPLVRVV